MSRNTFYVYELWNPIKVEVFYVGKSYHKRGYDRYHGHLSEARRVLNNKLKSNHKINTIIKILREGYDVDFRIVYETNDETDAFNKEMELIKLYGRKSNNTGILTNLCDGGQGSIGYKAPIWLKQLYSKQRKGEGNPMFGKTHSEKSRSQISETRNSKLKSGEIIPVKHTEEWKQHLRYCNAGGKTVARSVYQIDTQGIIIACHDSLQQAGSSVSKNKNAKSNIQCSIVGSSKVIMPYGYFWRYIDDYDANENFKELSARVIQHKIGKQLEQYDLHMNFVKVWDSISAALKEYDIKASTISCSIKKCTPHKGYYWKLVSLC